MGQGGLEVINYGNTSIEKDMLGILRVREQNGMKVEMLSKSESR